MMDRKAAGGLASLTANYTDSDASDGEDEVDDGYAEDETGSAGEKNSALSARINNGTANDLAYLTTESNTNSVSEMGHITDEEMSGGEEETRTEGSEVELSQDATPDQVVQLPPEPPGWCSKQLQEKIAMKYEKMLRDGEDLNQQIQNQKQFRNPSIYEKLIQFCQIDEMGTNYSQVKYNSAPFARNKDKADVFDTRQFDSSSYYEELAKAQMIEMDKVMEKRKKEQKERTKIEFISGTKKPSLPLPLDSRAEDSKKRKSKWDVAAVVGAPAKPSSGALALSSSSSAGAPSTAAPSNGSKPTTVISAYGTIAKKTKT